MKCGGYRILAFMSDGLRMREIEQPRSTDGKEQLKCVPFLLTLYTVVQRVPAMNRRIMKETSGTFRMKFEIRALGYISIYSFILVSRNECILSTIKWEYKNYKLFLVGRRNMGVRSNVFYYSHF